MISSGDCISREREARINYGRFLAILALRAIVLVEDTGIEPVTSSA